jgi:hypothetical protein
MRIDHYNPLAALKAESIKAFTTADDHLARVKRKIDELSSDTAKATYSTNYRQSQIAHETRKASADAKERLPEITALATRLESARQAWTTESLMRKAKLTPDSEDVNAQILAEMRLMRVTSELQAALPNELVAAAVDAKATGNLAMLHLVKKEATRRKFDSITEKGVVHTEIDRAINEVEIPEQKQAMAMLDDIQLGIEMAQDTLTELSTGKETDRAHMRRVMAEQAARKDDE